MSSNSGNSRSSGICGFFHAGSVEIGFLQTLLQVEMITHRRHATIDGAGADSDQHLTVLAEFAQHMHVFRVAYAALNQTDVARTAMFDIGERRAVKFDDVRARPTKPFIHIQKRHVAAETTGQRGGGNFDFTLVLPHFSLARSVQANLADLMVIENPLADRHL